MRAATPRTDTCAGDKDSHAAVGATRRNMPLTVLGDDLVDKIARHALSPLPLSRTCRTIHGMLNASVQAVYEKVRLFCDKCSLELEDLQCFVFLLSAMKLTDEDCFVLATIVASGSLANLQTLWLNGNRIGDEGMAAFSTAIASGSLPALAKVFVSTRPDQLVAACEPRRIQITRI